MKNVVFSLLLLVFISYIYAHLVLVYGGDFTRVGAKKSNGLAVYHSQAGWMDLHIAPPTSSDFFTSITAMTPVPGTNSSAWIAVQDGIGFEAVSNVYLFDGSLYHLLGYSFRGTINHLFYNGQILYATGDFIYYYTAATEEDDERTLYDFAQFTEPTTPSSSRSKRWTPSPNQNTNENVNNQVSGTPEQGFAIGSIIMIRSGNTLYWNSNPGTGNPDNTRRWSNSLDDGSANLQTASVNEIVPVPASGSANPTLYLWGSFTLRGDSTNYGAVSTTDLRTFNPVYNNATIVGDQFSEHAVAFTSNTIFYADRTVHVQNGGNRYRIARIATTTGVPTQIGYWFSQPAQFLWLSESGDRLFAYFGTAPVVQYYRPNSASNLDDLPEYGYATYIAKNGFISIAINTADDWAPALGGGVDGSISSVAVSGSSTFIRGSISYTYDESAFGLVGWDDHEESWVDLGHPLLDAPNSVRYPGARSVIIAVEFNEADETVVFGGEFATIANVTFNSIGIRNADGSFLPFREGLSRSTVSNRYDVRPGVVHTIEQIDEVNGNARWAIGGAFDYASDTTVRNIAMWDGEAWSAMGAGVDGPVWALEMFDGDVIVGGNFQTAGNIHAPYVARYDPDNDEWLPMSVGTSGPVYTIFNDDGTVYIGGNFNTASGRIVNGSAVWNNDEQVWEPLHCDACDNNCRDGYENPEYCLRANDVVYEIRSIANQGLYFRINSGLYLWDENKFTLVTVGTGTQTNDGNPQKLLSSNDLAENLLEESITVAGLSGSPFLDDNRGIGSIAQDGHLNYHTFGGIQSTQTIHAVSASSFIQPVFVLLLSLVLVVLLF